MMRTCKKCGVERPIQDFPTMLKCRGGHSWQCKPCIFAHNKAKITPEMIAQRPREIAKVLLAQGLKKCTWCKETKPIAEYNCCIKRFTGPNGLQAHCKACEKNRHKEFAARPGIKDRKRNDKRRIARGTPRVVMQITLRHGLKRRPTENPATINDLMGMFETQNGCCAVTRIRMTWAQGKVLPTSISLDRIDPEGGYSADNLRLICHCVNAFKGRMSDAEMLTMAKAIVANMDKSEEPTFSPAEATRIREMLADPAMVETLGPYIVTKYQAALAGMVAH